MEHSLWTRRAAKQMEHSCGHTLHPGCMQVGPVIGEARKKVRPCFTLLEGRYGGVSQERGRYLIGEQGAFGGFAGFW
jgi:hypothetical protein